MSAMANYLRELHLYLSFHGNIKCYHSTECGYPDVIEVGRALLFCHFVIGRMITTF